MQTQIAPLPIPDPPSNPQRNLPNLSGIPAPVKALLRPMLYASVGLHALLLFVPFGAHDGDKPKLPKDQAVKVTQLPPTSKGAAKLKQNIKSVPVPKTPLPVRPLARTSTSTIPPETKKTPPPDPTKPEQQQPDQKTSPTKGLEQNNAPVNDPFVDFPRYPNASPGSGGALSSGFDKAAFQTADDASAVINFYNTEAPKKQFDIKPSSDQGGLKVFTVSKAGSAPQYLHILSGGKGTVILLAPQEIPASALKNAKVETESPEGRELDRLIADDLSASVSMNTVDQSISSALASVDGFKAEIGDAFKPDGSPIAPADFAAMLNGLLSSAGFELSQAGSYGGGVLYKVTKNNYTGYITLMPTPAGSTAVFTWTKQPQ